MDVKIEIYKKGITYTNALEIRVTNEDRGFVEDILLDNELTYKVTPIETKEDNTENW